MLNEFIAAFWASSYIDPPINGIDMTPTSVRETLSSIGFTVRGGRTWESRDQPYLYIVGLRIAHMPGTQAP
jgi:hypothetical protein